MLQLKRDNHSVWILTAALFCCSTSMIRGEDAGGSNPDSSIPSSASGSSRVLPPIAESSSSAYRDLKYYLESTWSIPNVIEAGFLAGVPAVTNDPAMPSPPTVI